MKYFLKERKMNIKKNNRGERRNGKEKGVKYEFILIK